jgi:uncharacterized protein
MDSTVDVTIPVEPEAAATLADARNRAAVGRLVSRVLRPRSGPSALAQAIAALKAEVQAAGLTDADIDAELIVFDASALISAALKVDSVPERALLRAEEVDVFALSPAVEREIVEVLNRPKLAQLIRHERREYVLGILRDEAVWFKPTVRVADCRDPKDDKYLKLALAAGAETIVSSDDDLLVLHPWRGIRILRLADYLALF